MSSVIYPKNQYREIIKILDEPVLKNVAFQFNLVEEDGVPVDFEEDYLIEFGYDMFLGYVAYFRNNKKDFPNRMIEYNFSYLDDTVKKFKTVMTGQTSGSRRPCEPGRMRLFVDYEGNFFLCERVSENSSCMNIGSLDNGFKVNHIKDKVFRA